MQAFVLDEQPSVANTFLAELRDKNIQQDSLRFRKNLERLGEIMAYEISATLPFKEADVPTPLGDKATQVLAEQPVLISIMRAGLPYFQGFLNYFDRAESGFIGAYRKEDAEMLSIELGYVASPSLEGKTLILIDPMLATGQSIIRSVNALLSKGKPKQLHIACVVASPEGMQYLQAHLKLPYMLWVCSVDEKLDTKNYIVPGLGDAGDLCYGDKL
ncbi:MAG TPA: uracil phosphoribosyltransferase [Cyclobacteriaceae bacterium]|nr:uracil phosphoribosyltransferase [Cyclobacteriaceae bacterium]